MFRLLKSHSCEIKIHDPYVSKWHELEINVSSEIDDLLLDNPELIIISTAHTAYKSDVFLSKLIKLDNLPLLETHHLYNYRWTIF